MVILDFKTIKIKGKIEHFLTFNEKYKDKTKKGNLKLN